ASTHFAITIYSLGTQSTVIGQEHDFTRPLDSAVAISYGKGRATTNSAESRLCLNFVSGLCTERTGLLLTKARTSIGRGETCDIVLDGETVSRLHCEIVRFGAVYIVQDFSRNGTFINSQRVQQSQLQDGDQLRIGQNVLRVQVTSAAGTGILKSRETVPHHLHPMIELNPHIVIKGLEEGVTQPFSEERISIGRRMDNQVMLDADNISRNHVAIERRGSKYYARDLESINGTYLNDERIDLVELHDGDRLRVGNYNLTINLLNQDCVLNFKKSTK
ncbi:MAG: FHA domain-containing protein, partial [Blastocatellia bacterium]